MRSGYFRETIAEHVDLTDSNAVRLWSLALVLGLAIVPFMLNPFYLSILTMIAIIMVGALGLNVLTGWTGLISLGHVGFMVLGAYAYAISTATWGLDPLIGLALAGIVPAIASLVVGIPSLRLTGLYLAITTLAFSFIINHLILSFDWLTRGARGIFVFRPTILGISFESDIAFAHLCLLFAGLALIATLNIRRSRIGRAFVAIRDNDTAARVMGVNLHAFKLFAFVTSSFIIGISGALYGIFLSFVTVEGFPFLLSIEALAILIVGGIGTALGAVLGTIFIVLLPEMASVAFSLLGEDTARMLSTGAHELKSMLYGVVIILFLRFQPHGIVGLWRDVKRLWVNWPLRY
jgi:branched-chain amino acid transport system permease protein